MISWKALIIGLVVTVLASLFGQAIYILLASYIGMMAVDIAFLSDYKQEVWFLFAILVFCLMMMLGGLVTSTIANHKLVLHAAIVGFSASALSVVWSASAGEVTLMGFVIIGLGTLSASWGGVIVRRAVDLSDSAEEL